MISNRPTRVQCFMEVAHVFAKRATCMRRNVGAIVVVDRNVVSQGYNGPAPGHPHCEGLTCPGRHECKMTIHAERNAIMRCPEALWFAPKDLYTTDSPCPACAVLIREREVRRVFFAIPYRITASLDDLWKWGIQVYQVLPAGYVMDWQSKEIVEIST